MRKAIAGVWASPSMEGTLALIVTAAFFTLGGLLGCLLAFRAEGSGAEAMREYLAVFLTQARAGELASPETLSLLWRTFRWPLAAFLLGLTALGVLFLPLLSALRGFFLAFSVASFARAFGRGGVGIAFLLLGATGLVAVPVFFLLTVQGFSSSVRLAAWSGQGRRGPPYDLASLRRCGACAAALSVCALLECYLVPGWVASAAAALSL